MNLTATRKNNETTRNRLPAILLMLCFLLPGSALAETPSPGATASSPDLAAPTLAAPMLKAGPEDDMLSGLSAIAEAELSDIRGGEGTAINLQDMSATVDGNSISGNVTTGSVNIGANAFNNLDGVSSVVVNSGNNVLIQSSTVINIVISE